METIYWIQRIGTISTMAIIIGTILVFVTLCLFLLWVNGYDFDDDESVLFSFYRRFKGLNVMTIIILLVGLFTPSEKELYAIYGIGGTIDYIKNNDTAKELPDKALKALDAWIDDKLEKKSNEE